MPEDERLRVHASWLRGATSGRWALVLQYAVGMQGFEQGPVRETVFDSALHFYAGASPLHALAGQQAEVPPRRMHPAQHQMSTSY